jgi:hypothetical protein
MSFYSDAEKKVSMGKSMINLVRSRFKSDILDPVLRRKHFSNEEDI